MQLWKTLSRRVHCRMRYTLASLASQGGRKGCAFTSLSLQALAMYVNEQSRGSFSPHGLVDAESRASYEANLKPFSAVVRTREALRDTLRNTHESDSLLNTFNTLTPSVLLTITGGLLRGDHGAHSTEPPACHEHPSRGGTCEGSSGSSPCLAPTEPGCLRRRCRRSSVRMRSSPVRHRLFSQPVQDCNCVGLQEDNLLYTLCRVCAPPATVSAGWRT